MTFNHDDNDFIFRLTDDISLVNDLVLRRDVLDRLPIPLILSIDGAPVWKNTWATYLEEWTDSAWIRGLAHEARESTAPQERVVTLASGRAFTVHSYPVTALDGTPVATLHSLGNPLAGVAMDMLETAVMVARNREIVWSNGAARRAFGLTEHSLWDDLYGFPAWDEVVEGAMTSRQGEYRMRCLGIGEYVLVESWRPDAADMMDTIPMEQVASLVHEIRNPLAALSGYIEMAQLEADPGSQNYYQEMMQEIDRLSRFTADLMAVARPISVNPDWTVINDLVEHAWFAAGRGRRPKKKAVTLKKSYDETQQIWADRDRLQQVVTNLVKNAVEALSQSGSVVEVECHDRGDHWLLAVSDDGPGLPPDLLGRLFVSRFTTKDSGNGFGLMIVRRIAEAHGGTVRVTVDGGTRVEVTIPKPDNEGR
ncbi:sensor histidine kinase [Sulfobacillus harzensis]|uniref:histidine kinase n=1 Tax=Sulfobacillus harzensis TaxID=2729629 RepID=A0A7Y0L2J3_9FIRM|nr:HAMP domain-containing sensor histidine kinase [Sulfobacillus harzensis]NMP21210.1 HAMP domain-containing histidine kinase [Sulfobacillus harzensis]